MVPRVVGTAALSSTAINSTAYTNETKLNLSAVDGNLGHEVEEEREMDTRAMNSDDALPKRAPDTGGYSQLSGADKVGSEGVMGRFAMPINAIPQRTPSPTVQEEDEPRVTLLEHATPAPLPAVPTTSGEAELQHTNSTRDMFAHRLHWAFLPAEKAMKSRAMTACSHFDPPRMHVSNVPFMLLSFLSPLTLIIGNFATGRIEFLSPAASGLFASSAKQLSSPSYVQAKDTAYTGSKRDVQVNTESMGMTIEEESSHSEGREVLGIRLPSMSVLIAIACGSVTLIAMVSCSVSYGIYLRRERSRGDDEGESTDSDSDGTDEYGEQSDEDEDDGNVLSKDDDGDTCMNDGDEGVNCTREPQRNPRSPAELGIAY